MQGAGCRVQGAGCRVQGAGCKVRGAGCRVQGVVPPMQAATGTSKVMASVIVFSTEACRRRRVLNLQARSGWCLSPHQRNSILY